MVSSFGIHTYLAKTWMFIMNTPYNKDFQIDFNQNVSEIAANWWTDTWNQIIDVQKAYKYHKKDHYPSRELNPDHLRVRQRSRPLHHGIVVLEVAE